MAQRCAGFDRDPQVHRQVIERLMEATLSGDVAKLLELLALDVSMVVDSDGKVRGIPRPVHSADKVARFFVGAGRRSSTTWWWFSGTSMASRPR